MILACHYAHEDGFQMVTVHSDQKGLEAHLAALKRPYQVLETERIKQEDYDRWRAARITVHGFDDLI